VTLDLALYKEKSTHSFTLPSWDHVSPRLKYRVSNEHKAGWNYFYDSTQLELAADAELSPNKITKRASPQEFRILNGNRNQAIFIVIGPEEETLSGINTRVKEDQGVPESTFKYIKGLREDSKAYDTLKRDLQFLFEHFWA